MIDSIVISWNEVTERYTMTIMNCNSIKPIESHKRDSIEEILDIIHLKVKDETKYTS